MSRRVLPSVILAALAGLPWSGWAALCPGVSERLAPLPGVQAVLEAGQPLTIVALGSSSTEGAGASSPLASYPNRLDAALRSMLPGVELRVVNAGKSGETSEAMLARLEADVLAHKPELVIWQAGGNEVLLGHDPGTFLTLMRQGLRRLRQSGIEVVLMDNQRAPRILEAPTHAPFDAAMQALAREERVPLFARSRLMRGWQEAGLAPNDMLAPDGLHHNDRGYACLAEALAAALIGSAGQRDRLLARH